MLYTSFWQSMMHYPVALPSCVALPSDALRCDLAAEGFSLEHEGDFRQESWSSSLSREELIALLYQPALVLVVHTVGPWLI